MLKTVINIDATFPVQRTNWNIAQDPPQDDSRETPGVSDSRAREAPRREAEQVSEQNFDELYNRYSKSVFNIIYQWIGDYDEAADLTQETFVSAYKAIGQFRGEARIYTWLYRIAHNHCKNRFKQRDRLRRVEGPSLDVGLSGEADSATLSAPTEVPDWTYSPSEVFDQKELRVMVDAAVNSLAFEYKEVLILREVEGMAYSEIAEVTGLTMETVKTRLNRARTMVRKKIEPYYRT